MEPILETLSDDAKSVAAAFFPTLDSKVTFHMETSGPSARSQAALDELCAAGVATKETHDRRTGAATYRPAVDCTELCNWRMIKMLRGELDDKFTLWEKLKH